MTPGSWACLLGDVREQRDSLVTLASSSVGEGRGGVSLATHGPDDALTRYIPTLPAPHAEGVERAKRDAAEGRRQKQADEDLGKCRVLRGHRTPLEAEVHLHNRSHINTGTPLQGYILQ